MFWICSDHGLNSFALVFGLSYCPSSVKVMSPVRVIQLLMNPVHAIQLLSVE